MTAKKTPETAATVEQPENNDCFIIMPIADHPDYKQGHFKRVYDDIFTPACRAAGYKPIRADDVAQTNLIHLDILQKLLESPMAICDLSTRNPNVLFELGLRQAFDKPTVLVQEVGTPQIFDINLFRYTQYRNELDYRDVLADQKAIQKMLEETKIAVQENKSVNSIIKLLSITNPATLQDPSNFGDKEYFSILMSELSSMKNEIQKLSVNNSIEFLKNNYNNDKLDINSDKIVGEKDYIHLDLDSKSSQMEIKKFFNTLQNIPHVTDLSISQNNLNIMFKINRGNIKTSEVFALVKLHDLKVINFIIDELPF